jgi:ubiquinone/menaquinone biosynthesis C-methylase UbiE
MPLSKDLARVYWDIVDVPYQMGVQKHRMYLLDLLGRHKVNSILDVGCGTGPIYQIIKEELVPSSPNGKPKYHRYSFNYKGVDYSENFITCAQEMFGSEYFEIQDARELKEADSSYDCVLLMHALDHMKEYDLVIAEAARVSSKYVCIILWRAFSNGEVQVNDRNMMNKEEGEKPWEDTYLMQYSKESLLEEFKKNGLVVKEEAYGEVLDSGQSKYNYLFLLEKK